MISMTLNPQDNIQDILNGYPLDTILEVFLEPGIYHQKLCIKHHHLKLCGASDHQSILVYDDYSYKMHQDGLLYNTFRTSTLTVLSHHVVLKDLVIKNSSGTGLTIGQAIALSLYGDHTLIENCKLLGHQDTVFIGPLPLDLIERYQGFLPDEQRQSTTTIHLFYQCYIEGDVDFIFGSGTALFEQSEIVALGKGYIAAPSTYSIFDYGLIFHACTIVSKSMHHDVYLARPWRAHGAVHFVDSMFIGTFADARYDHWNQEHYRFFEHPYHQSTMSKALMEEGVKQLKIYCDKILNCFKND